VILADTSAWVEYDRASDSTVDRRLTELIADDAPIAVTEPVIMEVLAGARTDERESELRRLLMRFELLTFNIQPHPAFGTPLPVWRGAGCKGFCDYILLFSTGGLLCAYFSAGSCSCWSS
jgi:hypothetical protein